MVVVPLVLYQIESIVESIDALICGKGDHRLPLWDGNEKHFYDYIGMQVQQLGIHQRLESCGQIKMLAPSSEIVLSSQVIS